MRADVTIPDVATAVLFWKTERDADFDEQRADRIDVRSGRQMIILSTQLLEAPAELRFDPGNIAGRYVVHSVEVRASFPQALRSGFGPGSTGPANDTAAPGVASASAS
jgi:hypothetical protein